MEKNHILPFFWQHGESEEILRENLAKIDETGIKAVCVESRPHPDFVGEKWWEDLRIIIDEAKRRNMKVWILDDAHFPTGYANGAVKNAPDSLKKWHLNCKVIDVRGPLVHHRFALTTMLGVEISFDNPIKYVKEEVVAVLADRRITNDSEDTEGVFIDLTDRLCDGHLQWNVPEGIYRIFVITKKLDACKDKNDYINLLEPDSVKLLIDEVYEKHYTHVGDEFGKTIAGFFSDEPGFYNSAGSSWDFDLKPGCPNLPLPWTDRLLDVLEERVEFNVRCFLPCLWFECGEHTRSLRYHYMDVITQMYSDNFTKQIGTWCANHKVEYIGHVLEDNDVHMRLGSGTGHYFRSMDGQDMAGIDVIMSQVMPGNDYARYSMITPDKLTDGEFYHYGLAKLGSSAGHILPKTNGNSLVELFGAYGWFCGVTLMKWLTDHMLVRGINNFVPHAFSPAPFPDPDCPPHFYAGGNNPQYHYMSNVFGYMNRMSELLSDGRSAAKVAVYYPVEGEWIGNAMPFHRIGKVLMHHQIDFDVVPYDLLKTCKSDNKTINIGQGSYQCLIIPEMDYLPDHILDCLSNLRRKGLPVYWINKVAKSMSLTKNYDGHVIELSDLYGILTRTEMNDILMDTYLPHLRYYHYVKANRHVYMFFNESIDKGIEAKVVLPNITNIAEFDAINDRFYHIEPTDINKIMLELEPGEARCFVSEIQVQTVENQRYFKEVKEINTLWNVLLADYTDISNFKLVDVVEELKDISNYNSCFSGVVRYEASLQVEESLGNRDKVELYIPEVQEGVKVYINGSYCGSNIAPPYRFDVSGSLKTGTNTLAIEVTTTLYNSQKDMLSQVSPIPAVGIIGKAYLRY